VIRIEREDWRLGFEEARRIGEWAHELGIDAYLWPVREDDRPLWRLNWRPVELLGREVRAAQSSGKRTIQPITWTRRLADGLARARSGGAQVGEKAPTWSELEQRRAAVWEALLPCADTIAMRNLPPHRVVELIRLLDKQAVQSHQMTIEFEHERVYPPRTGGEHEAAFRLLGKWRYIGEAEARRKAALEALPDVKVEQRVRELLAVKHPFRGLEGVAAKLLARPDFDFIQPRSASYRYRRSVSVHQPARRYFFEDEPEEATPRVFATLDSELQGFLHDTLERTAREHRAAAAMAIVVEVETGDVLAVDGFSPYEVSEFLPTNHLFSPGSTFKVVVMSTALQAGVVRPSDEFDTHDGSYHIPNSGRTIHEARGAPKGFIRAHEAIAYSVNAVMVQIGMRIPDEFFYRKLLELGYGQEPGSGLGRESVVPVARLPWTPAYTHASISFGHEISVTLWQHAAALATILRGGVSRPLRLASGVEWGDERYRLFLEDGPRVFSEGVCDSLREMLAEGARDGTGRHIYAREQELGTRLELLSKTGTTEKEADVVCLHVELEGNQANAKLEGGPRNPAYLSRKEMKRREVPHERSCYTSSICLVGRVTGSEREVMVLLVVDEPRSRKKYGSDVAGPAAIAVLKEALDLTMGGVPIAERASFVPTYGYEGEGEGREHPWVLSSLEIADDQERGW
jgi:hypothetical protein